MALGVIVAVGRPARGGTGGDSRRGWSGCRSAAWRRSAPASSVGVGFPRGSDPESLDRAIARIRVGSPWGERGGAGAGPGIRRVRADDGAVHQGGRVRIDAGDHAGRTDPAGGAGGRGAGLSVIGRGQGFASGGGGGSVAFRIKLLGYSFEGVERLGDGSPAPARGDPAGPERQHQRRQLLGTERAISVAMEPDRAALARAGRHRRPSWRRAIAREVRGPAGRRPDGTRGRRGDREPQGQRRAGALAGGAAATPRWPTDRRRRSGCGDRGHRSASARA